MKKVIKFSAAGLGLACLLCACSNNVEGSAGIKYTLSEDSTYYIASHYDQFDATANDELIIGNIHEGLPVKEVASMFTMNDSLGDSMSNLLDIKKITVSDGITTLGFGSLWFTNAEVIDLPNGIEEYPMGLCLCSPNITTVYVGKGLKTWNGDFIAAAQLGEAANGIEIYFRGTEAEWNEIEFVGNTPDLVAASTIHYNYKG